MSFAEFLMEMFGIEKRRAETVEEDEFLRNFSQLESLFDSDTVEEIVKSGKVIDYSGTFFSQYLSLAREVVGKMGNTVDNSKIPVYYSIETLKSYLEGPKEEKIDFSGVEFFRYHLFDPENEQSSGYLAALIDDGKVQVGSREHWRRTGRKLKGAKGFHILTNITAQISRVCDSIGVSRPNYNVNGGQLSLTIKDETRELLGVIREAAYDGG